LSKWVMGGRENGKRKTEYRIQNAGWASRLQALEVLSLKPIGYSDKPAALLWRSATLHVGPHHATDAFDVGFLDWERDAGAASSREVGC
jgi:hypothetical protein